jgi:hypothetical protein
MKPPQDSQPDPAPYYRIITKRVDEPEPSLYVVYSRDALEPILRSAKENPLVENVTVEAKTDWPDFIAWLASRKTPMARFEPALTCAIKALVNAFLASDLLAVIDIAKPLVAHDRLSRSLEVELTNFAIRAWATGNQSRIHTFYAELESHLPMVSSAGAQFEARRTKTDRGLPPFIEDHHDVLLRKDGNRARIVMAMPRYVLSVRTGQATLGREEEFLDYLLVGAESAGHEPHHIDTTRINTGHDLPELGDGNASVDSAIAEIRRFAPDLVVLDANFVPDPVSDARRFIAKLRELKGLKVVGLVHDFYGSSASGKYAFWKDFCDLLLTVEPSSYFSMAEPALMKLHFLPAFWRRVDGSRETKSLFFSGTPRMDRLAYTAALADAGANIEWNYLNRRSLQSLTVTQYRNAFSRNRFALNSGRRKSFAITEEDQITITTGRSFEAIFAGCCLLERKGSSLDHFFTPGEHYCEFDGVEDLMVQFAALREYPERAHRIADAGRAISEKYYTPSAFWNLVLHHLDG